MKKTVQMLLASVLCVLAYFALVAIKRQLLPSANVLAESALLLLIFAPIVAVALAVLWRKRTFAPETSAAVFVIFLLGAACFNLTVPGLADRSFSLHLLNAFDRSANGMTEADMRGEFRRFESYAVRKRLREQLRSGILRGDGDRYHITASGRAIIATARFLGDLYRLDLRIFERRVGPVDPVPRGVPPSGSGAPAKTRSAPASA